MWSCPELLRTWPFKSFVALLLVHWSSWPLASRSTWRGVEIIRNEPDETPSCSITGFNLVILVHRTYSCTSLTCQKCFRLPRHVLRNCVFFTVVDGRAFLHPDYFERAVLGEPHLRKAKKGSKDFTATFVFWCFGCSRPRTRRIPSSQWLLKARGSSQPSHGGREGPPPLRWWQRPEGRFRSGEDPPEGCGGLDAVWRACGWWVGAFDWPRDVVARCFWANMGFQARLGGQCPTGGMTKDLRNPTIVVLQKRANHLHVKARTAPQNLRQSYLEQKVPGNATVERQRCPTWNGLIRE